MPWYNRIDARFLQDFYLMKGDTRHTLEFTVDVINLPNLFSKNWGIRDQTTTVKPLTLKSVSGGEPTFTLAEITNDAGVKELVTHPFQKVKSFSTTWGLQLGLRYKF